LDFPSKIILIILSSTMALSFDYHTQYRRYRRFVTQLVGLSQLPAVSVYVELSVTLLVIAFFSLVALKPTATTIASLISEINNQQDISEKLSSKIDSLAAAQATYTSIKQDLTLIDQALPPQPQLPNYSYQLELLAFQTNTTIQNLSFEPFKASNTTPTPPSKPPSTNTTSKTASPKALQKNSQSIEFRLSVSGDYQSLRNFSDQLTQSRRLISINSLSVRTRPKQEDLHMQIQGHVHYL
jgi:Tfp pilus assembly protein PilO